MTKLNQIIAIQAGKKSHAKETLTEAYHKLKKADLLAGIVRTYQPRDEDEVRSSFAETLKGDVH